MVTEVGITPARLEWRADDLGNVVPISLDFGDVYYSLVDGLAESRYVFIEQNHLPERFTKLWSNDEQNNTFTIAELGFGTGLNFLATWQVWHTIASQQASKTLSSPLHFVSFEKYPLTLTDLARSLKPWAEKDPTLVPLIARLLDCYPVLVAGCHRLHLSKTVTLDLWLGDAGENLTKLAGDGRINAWYLDGFAPKVNETLWATHIFKQMARLSATRATVSTFSCAGVVKRGLMDAGFEISKVKGFGRKREMLTGVYSEFPHSSKKPHPIPPLEKEREQINLWHRKSFSHVAVIGSGISGLMSAWALAQRGMKVTLLDKTAPLAEASGNPRAVLAPKMTPIAHVSEHLHSIGYLYAVRCYQELNALSRQPVFEQTGVLDLLTKANVNVSQIADYPDKMATTLSTENAHKLLGLNEQGLSVVLSENLFLPQGGLVNPQALADVVIKHDNIQYRQFEVLAIQETVRGVVLKGRESELKPMPLSFVRYASHMLDSRIFDFRKIRGQLSWFAPTSEQLKQLPKLPLKFGGYCAPFMAQSGDETLNSVTPNVPHFLFGASFVRNDLSTDIRANEHASNMQKVLDALPELQTVLDDALQSNQLYARVGIRAQTPDYHPVVGKVDEAGKVWTMSGMGSKGFAFAPLCSEVLADLMIGNVPAVSGEMVARLSPHRKTLQTSLNHTR